jgi:hypothetical protein
MLDNRAMTDEELIAEARDALLDAHQTMSNARIFVTSRERIKRPEGEDLYDATLQNVAITLTHLINALERRSVSPTEEGLG